MSYLPHDAQIVSPGQDLVGIVAALPSGSRLYLADGTYVIASPLTITGKTGISIEGGPGAIIQTGAHTGIVISGASSRITLRGFTLDERGTIGVQFRGTSLKFVDLTIGMNGVASGAALQQSASVTDVWVRGCTLNGLLDYGYYGAGFTATRLKFTRNYVTSTRSSGTSVGVYTQGTDIIVANNNIVATTSGDQMYGVAMYGAVTRGIIRGNTFLCGISGSGAAGECIRVDNGTEVVIEGNVIDYTSNAISVAGTGDFVIRGNTVNNATAFGIQVSTTARTVVSGNILKNIGSLFAGDAIGVYLSTEVTISGNQVVTSSRYGIALTLFPSSNVVIEGNELRACATAAIYSSELCSRVIVASNLIYLGGKGIDFSFRALSDSVIRGNTISGTGGIGIDMISSVRCNIQNNIVRSVTGVGIRLVSASYCTVNNNNVDTVTSNALLLTTCTDCVVDGNRLIGPSDANVVTFLGQGLTRVVINGNRIVSPLGYGLQLTNDGTPTPSTYCIVRSNQFNMTGSDRWAIYVASLSIHALIAGNEILGGTGNGIVTLAQYTQITSNRLAGVVGANPWSGIVVTGPVTDILIAGNHVTAYDGNGIFLDGAGGTISRVNVNGNFVSGCVLDGICLVDTDESMVQGNRAYGNTGYGINQDANSDQDLVSSNHVRGNTAGALNLLGTNLTNVNNKV